MTTHVSTTCRAIRHIATGGNLLIFATLLALIAANIPGLNTIYHDFWSQEMRMQVGDFNLLSHAGHPMTVLQFINDALMAIFFFNIGLEIKHEVLAGELSSLRQAMLPIMGAIGGMIVPVSLYCLLARGTDYIGGAAIPMATDIAFSLGIIALLGQRVPSSLKIFLTTLAVVDDIGGIIVIATFYAEHIDVTFIIYAVLGLLLLLAGSVVMKIKAGIFYFTVGVAVWFLVLNSGIHPTIAGVLVALCVPTAPAHAHGNNRPHPLIDYLIIPLFAFANAGIYLLDINPLTVVSGVSLAILVGLVVGKFTGILLFSWASVTLGLAPMPHKADWRMMGAVSLLGGIGFTVSLFIASLTFDDSTAAGAAMLNDAKLGIVTGSLIAGLGGYILLRLSLPKASGDIRHDNDKKMKGELYD